MRYILLLLPFLMYTECTLSQPDKIDPSLLQPCQSNDLEFHKPTIRGITHWKLIPAESRFTVSRTIIARISQKEEPEVFKVVDTSQQAVTLLEKNAHLGKRIEWFFLNEYREEETI